jgi:hypothetical protein
MEQNWMMKPRNFPLVDQLYVGYEDRADYWSQPIRQVNRFQTAEFIRQQLDRAHSGMDVLGVAIVARDGIGKVF